MQQTRCWWAACLVLVVLCTAAAVATTHTVSQKHTTFSPSSLTIKVGDSIRFVNNDSTTHQVITKSPKFSLGFSQKPGEEKTVVFPVAGDFRISCPLHPSMKLTVVVTK